MSDELGELLDKAIEREKESRSLYTDGTAVAGEPAAAEMLKSLADEESKHIEYLEKIKSKGFRKSRRREKAVLDLKIGNYLEGGEKLEGAGLQDTLIFAIRHEQDSIDFYSRLMSALHGSDAKALCETLVHEELKHKSKLEALYDDMVFSED